MVAQNTKVTILTDIGDFPAQTGAINQTPGTSTPPASAAGAAGTNATVTGGAGGTGNTNGGNAVIAPGAGSGTGKSGVTQIDGTTMFAQGAPAAKTVSATLTAAELLTNIITVNQGAAGASALQLPLATDLDTALPTAVAGHAFDFSVINISTVAAEDASLTTNTGWTLVGDMNIEANDAARARSSGRFRARKTAAGAWTLYRLA